MDQELFRIDFIHAIASKLRDVKPGRTALMKLAYFAQELKGVPLGYRFTLYSYGPFDSSVLSDLDIAQTMSAVDVSVNYHGLGYGYQIKAISGWRSEKEIGKYKGQIDEIIQRFGRLKPSELELLSTLIFVSRDAEDKHRSLTLNRLVEKTHEIKPHFSTPFIRESAEELLSEGFIRITAFS